MDDIPNPGGSSGATETRVRLLGPVELVVSGRVLELGPPKRRAVFAALAVDARRPVPTDVLVDRVWDQEPPAQVRNVLYAHVVRVRRVLAEAGEAGGVPLRVERRSGGYLLDVDPDLVDLHRFRRLTEQARRPDRDDAARAGLLREALALWRGLPLAGLSGAWVSGVREGCLRQRLDAVLAWAGVEARLGRPEAVIDPVHRELAEHPLVEPLAAVLIRALHATGRAAEALDCYAATRRRLADELGVEPGPELRGLQRAILRGELDRPAATPPVPRERTVPAQLPAAARGFTGRRAELADLDQLLDVAARQPASVVICALAGSAGVGKTTLAVHWGHRVADRFPDGQLYVNLRGFDPDGRVMPAAEAVRGFLSALGVPPDAVPPTLDAQAATYRSLLAGKRVLVVLDNAHDADQVRPLLPGTPTCLALVTSRNQLTPLVAVDGAHPLNLGLLSTVESRELLAQRLGAGRVAAEPDAVEQVIAACTRLPLALNIAAARAQQTGFPLATLAAELDKAGQRLDVLDAGDAGSQIRAVFSWSYRSLTPPAARLFRRLGAHPGPDISARAAASLDGRTRAEARRSLTELTRASLVTEHVPGRYALHDLLRAYAAELGQSQDPGDGREATNRMLDHYLHTAHAAGRLLNPHREAMRLPLRPPSPDTRPEHLADHREAMAWLTAEHRVLLAILRQAADAGLDRQAWQLAWALNIFLYRQGHWHDQIAAWRAALPAARRLDDPGAQADAHHVLGRADARLGRHDDAYRHLRRAGELFARAGDLIGQAGLHGDLAYLRDRQGQLEKALYHAQQGLNLYRAVGHQHGEAYSLNGVGWHHALLGDYAAALACCEQALDALQRLGDRPSVASTWDSLGYAHLHLGHYDQAAHCYRQALAIRRDLGVRYPEATTLTHLGDAYHAAGDAGAARAAWGEALDILVALGHPDAERLRAKLT